MALGTNSHLRPLSSLRYSLADTGSNLGFNLNPVFSNPRTQRSFQVLELDRQWVPKVTALHYLCRHRRVLLESPSLRVVTFPATKLERLVSWTTPACTQVPPAILVSPLLRF